MREIKFRAWEPRAKRMFKPFNLNWYKHGADAPDSLAKSPHAKWLPGTIFMQYTGLKDKTGREIYEGDILEGDLGKYQIKSGVVSIEDNEMYSTNTVCGFYAEELDSHKDCRHMDWIEDSYITGNIHQNPELLQEAS